MIKTLISVYDKKGIVEFAKELAKLGEIISTGGTAKLLKSKGVKVTLVSDYTKSKEILDGRVKTLHPKIFAGILGLRDKKTHVEELRKEKIKLFDIVVVNLYPFEAVSRKNKLEKSLENIDIGGVSLIRAGAKNYRDVAVIVDPGDYKKIINELKKGEISLATKERLAVKAFKITADYDSVIDKYLSEKLLDDKILRTRFHGRDELRYGENPHQKGYFYRTDTTEKGVGNAKQLHGKKLSYNNILDANDALELVKDFKKPTTVIIKHTTPSGVCSDKNIYDAYVKALKADKLSAFGSVVALNRQCTYELAKEMKNFFIEVIICPEFEEKALKILTKKKNIRLLETGNLDKNGIGYEMRSVVGGVLVQTRKYPDITAKNLKIVTKKKIGKGDLDDLIFSWKVNKYVRSNAIVLAKNQCTVGIGAGQTSRVRAVKLAVEKAGKGSKNSLLSSDAFFPFRDGIDEAAKGKIKAIIQPGGSIRDNEVIDACNKHGIAMAFTGIRLFKH